MHEEMHGLKSVMAVMTSMMLLYRLSEFPTDHFYPVITLFYPDGRGLFQEDSTPIHRVQGFTEWSDQDEDICYDLYKHSIRQHFPLPSSKRQLRENLFRDL